MLLFLNFMATSQSQHRCVFVGNIPYDATEEQLKEICEEVGPVVSFRLVIDRETGKPKGYGFCEYKDEETALSARRNLQGYEINGRQLRVDFAENDKNADRNREQGRGGPGMALNTGPASLGDATLHQPIGISVAMAAAAIMAQVLGAAQIGGMSNQVSLHGQMLGSDPLTLHLAKMSRNQLNEIMSEIKTMATENMEQARKLLLACPQLSKAVFQAQIMLGIVPEQMLQVQMPNIQQASVQQLLPSLQDGMQGKQSIAHNVPGLPPLPQIKAQSITLPQTQEVHSSSLLPNQQAALPQFPTQSQIQLPQLVQNKALHHGPQALYSGNSTLPVHPKSQGNFSFRSNLQVSTSLSLNHQIQPSVLQHPVQVRTSSNLRYIPPQSATTIIPDPGLQPNNSPAMGIPENIKKDPRRQVSDSRFNNDLDPTNHPSKLVRLNDGSTVSSSANKSMAPSIDGPSQTFSTSGNQIPKVEAGPIFEKQVNQVQLSSEVESALLQQVMNLTPEQLSLLPPEQQQQVMQLQQMLRQST